MKLRFSAVFCTDGDFSFRNMDGFFNNKEAVYKNAKIHYEYDPTLSEKIFVELHAEGNADDCRRAIRDLLEHMMCSINTSKYYLVKDIYDLLYYFRKDLWSNEPNQYKYNTLCGNYDGTYLDLVIKNEEVATGTNG